MSGVDAHFEILMNLHTGVVVHAPDTRIVFANKRAVKLLGLSEDQLLGRTAIDPQWCFTDRDGKRLHADKYPVSVVLATTRPLQETEFGVLAPGREAVVWVLASAFPEFQADGALKRIVVNFHDISVRRGMEADLLRSRAFAHSVLDSLSSHVCVLDERGCIIAVNQAWKDFFLANGGKPDYVHEGRSYLQAGQATLLSGAAAIAESAAFERQLQDVLGGRLDYFEIESACHSAEQKLWFFSRVSRMQGLQPMRIVVAHDNITALKVAQETLRASEHTFRTLFETVPQGVVYQDTSGLITAANPAALRILGLSLDQLQGRTSMDPRWHATRDDGSPLPGSEHPSMLALRSGNAVSGVVMGIVAPDRGPVWISVTAIPLFENGEVSAAYAIFEDITERKLLEDRVAQLAFYDPLTKLPNRRLMHDRLEQAHASCKRNASFGAAMVLDLDNFKPLNDRHGHMVGDLLLIQVAQRMTDCIREVDTVARFGGDEFVVIVGSLGPERTASTEMVAAIAEKIRLSLCQPYELFPVIDGKAQCIEHHCSASIGVVLFDQNASDAHDLLKRADVAMYQAKKEGRNRVTMATADAA
jgi:diguanylate cyclase (GGDEF)-like protein/PAS domain S-box-containing protein